VPPLLRLRLREPLVEFVLRAQADSRDSKFGVSGGRPEQALKDLCQGLLSGQQCDKTVDVLQYRVQCHRCSADAQLGLGEAYRQGGKLEPARGDTCGLEEMRA
jgi:hypothetical protein